MSAQRTLQSRPPREEALSLRVAELSSLLKAQRDEIEEQKSLLEHNRKITRDHEEIIRMQEAQLLERDAQIQAQNAEIRALRRQHAQDAEALRSAYTQMQGRIRPSGSMGTPRAVQQERQRVISRTNSPTGSPSKKGEPTTPKSTKRQLQQALADKVHGRSSHSCAARRSALRCATPLFSPWLTRKFGWSHPANCRLCSCGRSISLLPRWRRPAPRHAVRRVSERSLSTAWRLGQLGQLGLASLRAMAQATRRKDPPRRRWQLPRRSMPGGRSTSICMTPV